MKQAYLGDSYDAVKRMWQELFADWAPLYAEPRFIPEDLRADFTRMMRIRMLPENPPKPFSILNDPDTGIRLPGETNQTEGRAHITIETIINQLRGGARCVVTFDQSNYRNLGLTHTEQRVAKMRSVKENGFYSVYYISHACFLFAVKNAHALQQIEAILTNAGIPKTRLEI
jgi:hypothetical protein